MKFIEFSKEQREKIEDILNGYDEKNVAKFFFSLQELCTVYEALKKPVDMSDHRYEVKRVNRNLKKALKELKWILDNGLMPQSVMSDTGGVILAAQIENQYQAEKYVMEAYRPLLEIQKHVEEASKKLEDIKPKRGRLKADSIGLIVEIGKLFAKHIEKPTYKNDYFINLVLFIHKYLELPSKDLSRGIKTALKNF